MSKDPDSQQCFCNTTLSSIGAKRMSVALFRHPLSRPIVYSRCGSPLTVAKSPEVAYFTMGNPTIDLPSPSVVG